MKASKPHYIYFHCLGMENSWKVGRAGDLKMQAAAKYSVPEISDSQVIGSHLFCENAGFGQFSNGKALSKPGKKKNGTEGKKTMQ